MSNAIDRCVKKHSKRARSKYRSYRELECLSNAAKSAGDPAGTEMQLCANEVGT
jgi:hypothetical protein